jgi:hypothetical protein
VAKSQSKSGDVPDDVDLSDPKVFNPATATWESPGPNDAARIEEHEAQAKGEPAPGDLTAEERAQAEAEQGLVPAPVVTSSEPTAPSSGSTGATGANRTP